LIYLPPQFGPPRYFILASDDSCGIATNIAGRLNPAADIVMILVV
jgi:hypothetical protein